jgi:hypothetical protein
MTLYQQPHSYIAPFPAALLKRDIEVPIGGKAPGAMLIDPVVRIALPQDMRLASTPS